jgi:superfamily II DNA or RNA helicase
METKRAPLTVLYTGGGKTFCFSLIAKDWPRHHKLSSRVLVLAHRDEIVRQNRDELEAITGEPVGLEKAESFAENERLVSASVQSLTDSRLRRWKPDHFGLVIFDECHHIVSPSWKAIADYFVTSKLLGYTATPRRADRRRLACVFDSVACLYELTQAVADGVRPPFVVKKIRINDIDLSHCHKTRDGDFNPNDLDAAMAVEKALHGVVNGTLGESGDRRTVVFTTSVANAHRLAEMFNRYRPACARAVDGETETDTRRSLVASHKAGEFQYLVNVGIVSEGYNDEGIACIAMGRPTTSRLLIEQMIGRARAVGSPDALIIEFTGNMGKLRQSTTVDVLGGTFSDEVVAKADAIIEKKPGMRADDALKEANAIEEAKKLEIARRAALTAKVSYSVEEYNPFDVLHIKRNAHRDAQMEATFGGKIATERQVMALKRNRIPVPENCTSAEASRLLGAVIKRDKLGLANYGQILELGRVGIPAIKMSYKHACDLVWEVRRNGGKLPSQDVYDRIMSRERQAGE